MMKYVAAVLIGIAGLGLQHARADTVTYYLTFGNTPYAGPYYAGPYASVAVNRTSTITATITFTSLTAGGNIYLMGDGSSVAVNVNASLFSVSGITGSNNGTGFTPGSYSNGGSGIVDAFGTFNQTISSFGGFTHSSDTISFTLTNNSGTWGSASAVLTANSGGSLAAAHIFVTAAPANVKHGAFATVFAAGDGAQVPDGGTTVMLLAMALGALGMARRFLTS